MKREFVTYAGNLIPRCLTNKGHLLKGGSEKVSFVKWKRYSSSKFVLERVRNLFTVTL
jgi:hypothetical protein